MTPEQAARLDWSKGNGLIPAVIQHFGTAQVLMLGYMNPAALRITTETGRVTFFSRTKNRLWTKGESSGNFLDVIDIAVDCDNDSLLIAAKPNGPVCHRGTRSCFADDTAAPAAQSFEFLGQLENIIAQRVADRPEGSYTARLWNEGLTRMAQKVGEEGVEVALAAATQQDEQLIEESADLLFHLALLLKSRNRSLANVVQALQLRHAGTK